MNSKLFTLPKKDIHRLYCCVFFLTIITLFSSCSKRQDFNEPPGHPHLPGESIPLPDGAYDHIFKITDFGAVGDGSTMNTEAIQKALDTAAVNGGTVIVPAGDFLSGPLKMYSNTNLHLEKNGVLMMDNDISSYPIENNAFVNFIEAKDAGNIKITGDGTIYGQAEKNWWDKFEANQLNADRPQLVYFEWCNNVEIKGVHTKNPPTCHFQLSQCQNVVFDSVTISAPGTDAPNTDGINISGSNIVIKNCNISTGDDNIAFNVGHAPVTKNIVVKNCTFGYGHGVSIGSFQNGGLDSLLVEHCTFEHGNWGIRIKSARDRGGLIHNVTYSDITIKDVRYPILFNGFYPKAPKDPETVSSQPVTETTAEWKDITMKDITITDCPNSIIMWGLPEMPVKNVKFINLNSDTEKGMQFYFAQDIQFENPTISIQEGDKVTSYEADIEGL